MQEVVKHQINEMAKYAANRKVGIVTFNHEVAIIGDGDKIPSTITGS